MGVSRAPTAKESRASQQASELWASPRLNGKATVMKEVLYVQAGTFANFVGTHFWNTQEGYFTYADDQDPVVYHDRSFREGLNSKVKLISLSGRRQLSCLIK